MADVRWKISSGISLIEILIVVTIFAVLGIIISSSIILTLQGSKKSENVVAVRENLDYSMSIIERQIRNADSIDCDNSTATNLVYKDGNGGMGTFSCNGTSVASGSATLTSENVAVTKCSFDCYKGDPTTQPYVNVSLTGQSAILTGAQASSVTTNTRIYLRAY